MLTWLRNRPAGSRRAARPAQPKAPTIVPETSTGAVDEELPPPFFADADPAFLDMSERPALIETVTPPPLPKTPEPVVQAINRTPQERLTCALQSLPPWPSRQAPRRSEELMEILRQLDRIAGDVCNTLDEATEAEPFEPTRKPR